MKILGILTIISVLSVLFIYGHNQQSGTVPASGESKLKEAPDTNVQKNTIKKVPLKTDTLSNDFARLVCGLKPQKYYLEIAKTEYWKQHSAKCNEEWQKVNTNLLVPIKNWVVQNHAEASTDTTTLFYPFAGGDFVYANYFYPAAKNMVLVGLEPTGSIFNMDKIGDESRKYYLSSVLKALYVSNKSGFFRTASMRYDMNQKLQNGTLHALLFYMSRSGFELESITHFAIDSTGNFTTNNSAKNCGVKINYHDTLTGTSKCLYYLSYNLINSNLTAKPELFKFVKSFGNINVLLKSASYLMHNDIFSKIRDFITANANHVLQDDTGVPFKSYENTNWDIDLFGTYTRTIPMFAGKFQRDLAAAYKTGKVKDLPFIIGYSSYRKEANLLLAKRKKSSTSEAKK